MTPSTDERLMRIETLLEGMKGELQKGDSSFMQIKSEMNEIKERLNEQDKQLSYWKGVLAFVTIVWPVAVRYFMQ